MPTTKQKLLFCFLLLNVTLITVNIIESWQIWPDINNHMVTLTLLNTPSNSSNLRGSSNKEFLSRNSPDLNTTGDIANLPPHPVERYPGSLPSHSAEKDPESLPSYLTKKNPENLPSDPTEGGPASPPPAPSSVHPFDQLSKRLEKFDWDPVRIDEYVRQYWSTDKSFIRYQVDRKKNITPILSTSCIQTAGWIVTSLLELQTRPNIYRGLYKIPKEKGLIVYKNTDHPASNLSAPVTQSIRDFVQTRPLNESIVLQVDMYQLPASHLYNDHHFSLHIYNGQVSLYQGWLDIFNLIDWMKEPASHKLRYPMPIETFLGHFEKFLTYSEEKGQFERERLEAIWEIFGITETFVYSTKKYELDDIVRALRYPWVVSLITHWPHAHEADKVPVLSR